VQVGIFSRAAAGLVYRFVFATRLSDYLRRKKITHLHVHFAHVPTDIAMYAAPMAGIGFSVTAHANDIFERGWLLKQKVSRSRFFATISYFNRDYLQRLGVDTNKINIIRCGVDDHWVPPVKKISQQTEKNNIIRIGTVGRLVEKKGLDTLIAAVAKLLASGRQILLEIAGSGPLETDLLQQAKLAGLGETQIKFIGALPHDKVPVFINSLDIFVLPCKQDTNGDMDGIPVVLMEAMLCGVPVISTQLSGIPELVINEKTGLTIQPEDIEGLSKAICYLIDNNAEAERMVISAKKRVTEEFMLSDNVSKLITLFRDKV
jgi:glycosyltransferase involved in cell wall biosynthesis